MTSHYCAEIVCLRQVLSPNIYCDKHADQSSSPKLPIKRDALRVTILSLRLQRERLAKSKYGQAELPFFDEALKYFEARYE